MAAGKIDFQEFLSVMAKKVKDSYHAEELMAAFKVFDRDGDGESLSMRKKISNR